METEEAVNKDHKETLIYLDFNDKIPQDLQANKIFVRIANLQDKNPLVQINDMVFKGTYEYSIGTNLFFKKTSTQGFSEFPFQQPINFNLEFFGAQNRVLNCKQMRVPPTTATIPKSNEKIRYNFKWDYDDLLKNFEEGTLDLKNMIETEEEPEEEPKENESPEENSRKEPIVEPSELENIEEDLEMTEIESSNVYLVSEEEPYEELKAAYQNLQLLARTPVKRNGITEIVECDPKYSSSYDYRSIESKVLEPPIFSYFKTSKNLENYDISDCVDINRCSRLGIITPSDNFTKRLSEEEKMKVLTIENFENLDLRARYSVLLSHKEALEKQVEFNTVEKNSSKDEFGRTPLETLQIFKKLLCSLQKRIKNV